MCCLFFDLHILITPLVSSNSSYYIRRAASPEGIKLVVFYYLIVFEMWPEKRVGLKWEWSYSLFRTFGHLTIEGGESSKNPWDFAFYLNFNEKFDFCFFSFDFEFWCFNVTFSNISAIMAASFSGGISRREPLTMDKQLVSFITRGCESSAPFFVIYNAGREPTPYW